MSASWDLNAKYDAVAQVCRGFLELSLQLLNQSGFTAQADFVLWFLTRSWAIRSWSTRMGKQGNGSAHNRTSPA
jgi:hypothetical protein